MIWMPRCQMFSEIVAWSVEAACSTTTTSFTPKTRFFLQMLLFSLVDFFGTVFAFATTTIETIHCQKSLSDSRIFFPKTKIKFLKCLSLVWSFLVRRRWLVGGVNGHRIVGRGRRELLVVRFPGCGRNDLLMMLTIWRDLNPGTLFGRPGTAGQEFTYWRTVKKFAHSQFARQFRTEKLK